VDQVIRVGGLGVATYVVDTPRPYLHPITTLSGKVVSDAAPEDHTWHLGLSLAVQDVNATNLWGGRTYVRGQGYTWLDDHGVITHEGFDKLTDASLVQRLTWRAPSGDALLTEVRSIDALALDDRTWALSLSWALTAPGDAVVLGSPTTNGRELGAGYGGCFMRLAPQEAPPHVAAGALTGEEEVNGCTEPELLWRAQDYQIRFSGAQQWFVRTSMYPGVCDAWAFDKVRTIEAGQTWESGMRLLISDV
jgi:hypothetical protein